MDGLRPPVFGIVLKLLPAQVEHLAKPAGLVEGKDYVEIPIMPSANKPKGKPRPSKPRPRPGY